MQTVNKVKESIEKNLNVKTVAIAAGLTAAGLFFLLRKYTRRFVLVLSDRVFLQDVKSQMGDYKLIKMQTYEPEQIRALPKPLRTLFEPENVVPMGRLRSQIDVLMLTDECESTQTEIDQFFTHSIAARNNVACISLTQTNGKGYGSNSWTSQGNNVFLTFGFSLDEEYSPLLVNMAMTSVVHSLVSRIGIEKAVWIRFPNDILVGDDKVAGVLVQSSQNLTDPTRFNYKVGVGINVEQNGAYLGLKEVFGLNSVKWLRERLICEVISDFFDLLSSKTPEQLSNYSIGYVNQNLLQKGKILTVVDYVTNKAVTLTLKEIRKEDCLLVGADGDGIRYAIKGEGAHPGDLTIARLIKIDAQEGPIA